MKACQTMSTSNAMLVTETHLQGQLMIRRVLTNWGQHCCVPSLNLSKSRKSNICQVACHYLLGLQPFLRFHDAQNLQPPILEAFYSSRNIQRPSLLPHVSQSLFSRHDQLALRIPKVKQAIRISNIILQILEGG